MQMTPRLWQKGKEELKSPMMKVKEESENAGLKLNIHKDHDILCHHFMAKTSLSLFPKSLQMVTVAMKLKNACSLEEKL